MIDEARWIAREPHEFRRVAIEFEAERAGKVNAADAIVSGVVDRREARSDQQAEAEQRESEQEQRPDWCAPSRRAPGRGAPSRGAPRRGARCGTWFRDDRRSPCAARPAPPVALLQTKSRALPARARQVGGRTLSTTPLRIHPAAHSPQRARAALVAWQPFAPRTWW